MIFLQLCLFKKKNENKMEQKQSNHNPTRDETVHGDRDTFKSIQISKL